MQEKADSYRDQNLAKLFAESDWSQEKLAAHLAAKWGKEVSREYLSNKLRFGRFLLFFGATGTEDGAPAASWKLPANLTERAFRKHWEATTPGGNYTGHRANTEAAVK